MPMVLEKKFLLGILFLCVRATTSSQCPWQTSSPQLQAACLCASNSAKEVSVQCDAADYEMLLEGLAASSRSPTGRTVPIDLLYVNNSSLELLGPELVRSAGVVPRSVQVSGCGLRSVAADAFRPIDASFRGDPSNLRNLNLHSNLLENVPVEGIRTLSSLTLLDLSHNRITAIPVGAFSSLRSLATLRLGGNPLDAKEPGAGAFRGLASSLRNLDLKATRQRAFPSAAIHGLRALAFLDLSQNSIREIGEEGPMSNLDSLAALNLERNLVRRIHPGNFRGINDTLSSLSLLNNLLADFPTSAISTLSELRVLDLGFNLVANIPDDAFRGTPSLTLLALDGNPLATLSSDALSPVAPSLRGLSIGGRSLRCDCRLRWLSDWMRRGKLPGGAATGGDLQVTSREREPQFCGFPSRLREKSFHLIQPEEFTCSVEEGSERPNEETKEEKEEKQTSRPPVTTYEAPVSLDAYPSSKSTVSPPAPPETPVPTTPVPMEANASSGVPSYAVSKQILKHPTTSSRPKTLPPIVRLGDGTLDKKKIQTKDKQTKPGEAEDGHGRKNADVIVQSIGRQDNSVIIRWEPISKESGASRSSGYRVIYRLFGETTFRRGPPLEPTEREFRIKNVPLQECIVVCVTSLDRPMVTPETVPYSQCKEVRTSPNGHGANHGTPPPGSSTGGGQNMDKITIAASAAICGTVVLAVVVFVATSRKKHKGQRSEEIDEKKAALAAAALAPAMLGPHQLMHPHLVPMHTLHPVPYSQKGTLNRSTLYLHNGGNGMVKSQAPTIMVDQIAPQMSAGMGGGIASDWEQGSVYSGRSIPRPQVFPEQMTTGPMSRSHTSRLSGKGVDGIESAPNAGGNRSIADGQSQRSYSVISNNNYLSGAQHPLARPSGLRMSQHSLTNISLASERMSGHASAAGYPQSYDVSGNTCQHQHKARKNQGGTNRGGGNSSARSRRRYGTRSGYDTTSDNNWTDHDLDIYVARNPTRASGRCSDRLVQL